MVCFCPCKTPAKSKKGAAKSKPEEKKEEPEVEKEEAPAENGEAEEKAEEVSQACLLVTLEMWNCYLIAMVGIFGYVNKNVCILQEAPAAEEADENGDKTEEEEKAAE